MAGRLYSFQFPWDIRTTLESWRSKLSSTTGAGDFESVMARMSDRDRAIEDHLNLGTAQGILARASVTTKQNNINGAVDLAGLTGTFTVPANRLIKVSALVSFEQTTAAAGTKCTAFLFLYDQANTLIGTANSSELNETLNGGFRMVSLLNWFTPAAGTYTYRLQAQRNFDVGAPVMNTLASATRPATLLIEDAGPVLQ